MLETIKFYLRTNKFGINFISSVSRSCVDFPPGAIFRECVAHAADSDEQQKMLRIEMLESLERKENLRKSIDLFIVLSNRMG